MRLGLLCVVLMVGACQKAAPPSEASAKVMFAPGTSAKLPPEAVAAFVKEMKRQDLDLELHEVEVEELSDTWVLSTRYIHRPSGLRGDTPGHPEYEVEISKKDFTVKRVNGVK